MVPVTTRRRLLLAAAFAGVAVVTASVVWAALSGLTPERMPPESSLDTAEVTTATAPPEPTVTPDASATSGATEAAPPKVSTDVVAESLVAYRRAGALYVARPDGSGERRLASSQAGPYVLSPDGATLAHVSAGRLWLVRIVDGSAVDAGPALGDEAGIGECPVWSPDSRHLYVTRSTSEGSAVWRVPREDGTADEVMSGGCPSVSPDGRVVAAIDAARGVLLVARDGRAAREVRALRGVPLAVAAGNSELFIAVLGTDGSTEVVRAALDGSGASRVIGPPVDAPRATWGSLRLSPDGARLAALSVGDDRYSRVSLVDPVTRDVRPVSARRDCYARYWSADGARLYYIEGNAYQGEPTNLMSVDRSGAGRRVVVEGAE